MTSSMAGVVGAPVTPFNEDDSVDYETFARQIDFLINHGVVALAHPMHIGESPNLTDAERRNLATALVEASAGRVPTFVHVSSGGTKLSQELASHSAKVGASGIVLLAPYYWRSEEDELVEHFASVSNAHGGKLIAYNNPSATQVHLTVNVIRHLIERIPGFTAIKDASFHMETFTEFCRLAKESKRDVAVYTGVERLLTSMPVGGNGCFSGCSEVAPNLIRRLFAACQENSIEEARSLQFTTSSLLALLKLSGPLPVQVKYCMELLGRPVGEVRRPLRNLTENEKMYVHEQLIALGILDSEPTGWTYVNGGRVSSQRRAVGFR